MNAKEAEAFLADKFDSAWDYYDINGAGRIDSIGSSSLFRHLTRSLGAVDLH